MKALVGQQIDARADLSPPKEPGIRRVAVIGAGLLGRRLVELCCGTGYSVMLEDVLPSRLRGAGRAFEAFASADGTVGQVEYASTIEEAVRHADLVIDCVPDELESKLEILSLIDRMAPPRTIIATPTSSLSIADLASCTYRPERCVALRLSAGMLGPSESPIKSPPEREPASFAGNRTSSSAGDPVRITTTSTTDATVVGQLVHFWRSLGFEAKVEVDPLSATFP